MPGNRKWIEDASTTADRNYAFGGLASPGAETGGLEQRSSLKRKKSNKPAFPPETWGTSTSSGSYFSSTEAGPHNPEPKNTWGQDNSTQFETTFESDFNPVPQSTRHPRFSQSVSYTRSNDLLDSPNSFDFSSQSPQNQRDRSLHNRSMSMANPTPPLYSSVPSDPFSSYDEDGFTRQETQSPQRITPKPELTKPLLPHEGVARAIALYDFHASEVRCFLFTSVLQFIPSSLATYPFQKVMFSRSRRRVKVTMTGTYS